PSPLPKALAWPPEPHWPMSPAMQRPPSRVGGLQPPPAPVSVRPNPGPGPRTRDPRTVALDPMLAEQTRQLRMVDPALRPPARPGAPARPNGAPARPHATPAPAH